MWFLIGNKHRRFRIAKFVLMTGLRCISDVDNNRLKTSDDSLKEFYFKDSEKLRSILRLYFLLVNLEATKKQ